MTKQSTRDLILWLAFFAAPLAWLCSFQAKFSWTPWVCASQSKLAPLSFALIAFLLSALAGLVARRQWKELGAQQPGEAADVPARSRFMAIGAMVFSVSFCVVIVAQTIPDLILGVCQ